MKEQILEIKDLRIKFHTLDNRQVYALNGVNLSLDLGETVAVVGESGSGKTQLSLAIMNLVAGNATISGEIFFQGEDITKLSKNEINKIRGNKISMIFQDPMTSLNPYMRIIYQLTEVLMKDPNVKFEEAKKRSIEMLRMVSISEPEKRIYQYPHQFSGGMRQRVMIAMAILSNPLILIADEPTTALDVTIQAQILEIFQELKDKLNLSIILITHDLGVVYNVADKVAVMYGGCILEYGTRQDVFENPKHPYTLALLKSIPKLEQEKSEELFLISGVPPVLLAEPTHCLFADRCDYCFDKCLESFPEAEYVSDVHYYKCFLKDK